MAASDPDAWTFVPPRSRKSKSKGKGSTHTPRPAPGTQTTPELPSLKPRTENLRSVDEIEAEYRSVRTQWFDSATCTKLRELVKKHAVDIGPITKAVCLGVGTFDPEDGAWAQKRISYHQLIAFGVMVEELEKVAGSKIQCISQDPVFTESDKAFLTKLGHTVLESPAAYAEISSECLLYGVHLYRPVYAAAFSSELPRIFVGTGYDEWEGATMGSLDDIKPMKKMEDEYTKMAFPEDPIPATFFGTSIYWHPIDASSSTEATTATPAASASSTAPEAASLANSADPSEALADKLAATKIT